LGNTLLADRIATTMSLIRQAGKNKLYRSILLAINLQIRIQEA
jgi:hypothetical protein